MTGKIIRGLCIHRFSEKAWEKTQKTSMQGKSRHSFLGLNRWIGHDEFLISLMMIPPLEFASCFVYVHVEIRVSFPPFFAVDFMLANDSTDRSHRALFIHHSPPHLLVCGQNAQKGGARETGAQTDRQTGCSDARPPALDADNGLDDNGD